MSITFISSRGLYNNYQQLSSGKKVNSAADNAAALAIIEKLQKQSNGYDVGKRNAADSNNMLNVADGALGSITDSLQRMRELSVQASNTAIYGDSDLGAIQKEIDQLKYHISDVAKNTQFNGKNLLDGSRGSSHVAVNPDGSGLSLNLSSATLEALGIADYDVTKGFDISVLDDAIGKVSSARSELGASSNRLFNAMSYNSYASYNTTAAQSRLEDLDYAEAISDMKKNSLMEEYKLMMQRNQMHEQKKIIRMFE